MPIPNKPNRYMGAGICPTGLISTSRGLAPSAGPTIPSRSMRSIMRAERLYPMRILRWSIEMLTCRMSLTIATAGESAVSESEKSRPAMCGIASVLKNAGVIGRICPEVACPSAGLGRSTRQKLVPMQDPGSGAHVAPAAC